MLFQVTISINKQDKIENQPESEDQCFEEDRYNLSENMLYVLWNRERERGESLTHFH